MADYYLVDLIADEQTLELTPLDSIAALSRYFEEEGADRDGERDLVLTKGSSKEKLAKLYPNYFGDISDFVKLIEKNLGRVRLKLIRRLRLAERHRDSTA